MLALLFAACCFVPHLSFGPEVDFRPLSEEFPGRVQTRLYRPVPGRTWVTKYPSAKNPGTGYFAVGSERFNAAAFEREGVRYGREGELVFVARWEGNRGYLREGMQIETNWDGPAAMVRVDDLVTKDLRLADGLGTLHLALVDGALIENWRVPAGWWRPRAISLQYSRNVMLRLIEIEPPTQLRPGPGEGYGVQVQRSAVVNVSGLRARGCRHAFTVFSGGSIFLGSLIARDPQGTQVDVHGFGARQVAFAGLDLGGSDLSIGNRYGGDEAEVWMAENAKALMVYGRSTVRVYDSHFGGPAVFFTTEHGGRPELFEAFRSRFRGFLDGGAIRFLGDVSVGGVARAVFDSCALEDETAAIDLPAASSPVEILLRACTVSGPVRVADPKRVSVSIAATGN